MPPYEMLPYEVLLLNAPDIPGEVWQENENTKLETPDISKVLTSSIFMR
jgi:hypothetical protein